jgi:hypothetical protein
MKGANPLTVPNKVFTSGSDAIPEKVSAFTGLFDAANVHTTA